MESCSEVCWKAAHKMHTTVQKVSYLFCMTDRMAAAAGKANVACFE